MKFGRYLHLVQTPIRFIAGLTLLTTALSIVFTAISHAIVDIDPGYRQVSMMLSIVLPLLITPIVSSLVLILLRELVEAYHQLETLATTDTLTQIFNRRHVIEKANSIFQIACRESTSLGVLIIDYDHFKRINDTYGHAAGDHVLIEITGVIRNIIRSDDLFGRFGGEEFIVVCPGCDHTAIQRKADQINHAVRDHSVSYDGNVIDVTVSIGAAVMHENWACNLANIIKRADELLYVAKSDGRDRAVVCCRYL